MLTNEALNEYASRPSPSDWWGVKSRYSSHSQRDEGKIEYGEGHFLSQPTWHTNVFHPRLSSAERSNGEASFVANF